MVALLLALIIGVSLGVFGSGGAILTVPVFIYVLGVPTKIAIATALAVVSVISWVSLMPYALRGKLPWRLALRWIPTALLGAVLGSWISQGIDGHWQLLLLAILMLLSGVNMWRQQPWQWHLPGLWPALLISTLLGFCTGLLGVGGGFLLLPVLLAITALPMQQAVACSLLLVSLQSLIGFVSHHYLLAQQGLQPAWPLFALFAGVGAVGSLFGVALAARLPQLLLRRGFALLLVVVAGALVLAQWPQLLGHVS